MSADKLIRRLLLVEDMQPDALLITHYLRKLPEPQRPDLVHVTTLADALDQMQRSPFEGMLLDLGLPDGCGLDNVRRVRGADRTIAIVVMTGLDDDQLALEALRCGAQEYLVKGNYEGGELGRVLQHAVERQRLVTELDYERQRNSFLAGHDALTGLINRQTLAGRAMDVLSLAERQQQRFACCFLDLDGFKPINDRLGHAAGDAVLKEVARVLTATIRESDALARIGGDEFVALLYPVKGQVEAEAAARRFIERIAAIDHIRGHAISLGASAGLAVYPEHGLSIEDLVVRADQAMYAAKRAGRGTLKVHAEHAEIFATGPRRVAVDETSAALLFQPWADQHAGRPAGVEVLLRQRAGVDLQSPEGVLRSALELGLVVDLCQWVMNGACAQWARWRQSGTEPGQLAVNTSRAELLRREFASSALAILERHRVPPQHFQLEVPEDVFDVSSLEVLDNLRALRAHGVRVFVDHFGKESAALKRLRTLPVDGVKLDRSVVWGLRSGQTAERALAAAIVDVARSLDLQLIACGVEEQTDLERLQALDCRYLQGYLVARPMDAEQLNTWLAGQPAAARSAT